MYSIPPTDGHLPSALKAPSTLQLRLFFRTRTPFSVPIPRQ